MLFVLQSFANQFPSLEILDLSNNFIATVEEMVIFLLKKSINLSAFTSASDRFW